MVHGILVMEQFWVNEYLAKGALGRAVMMWDQLLFDFLSYLPYSGLTKTLALFIITLFFYRHH